MTNTMHRTIAALSLLGMLAACTEPTSITRVPDPGPGSSPPALAKAVLEVTFSNIGGTSPTASVVTIAPAGDVANTGGSGPAGSGESVRPTAAMVGRTLTPLPGNGSVQLEHVSTTTFTTGTRGVDGVRYISATYRVRNASSGGVPYGGARTNLTFLAVSSPGVIGGTPISQLRRFDGSDASAALAPGILPTGWARLKENLELGSRAPDVLQAYTENEIASIPPVSGVDAFMTYGFVVRPADGGNSRTLPVDAGSPDFTGLVTFAYRLPLQATADADPFSITARFVAIDDNETWLTQSVEEADGAGVAAIQGRATALSAGVRSLVTSAVGTLMCTMRTAGTVALPVHREYSTTMYLVGRTPSPGSTLPASSSLSAEFCQPMNAATDATFVVRGGFSGKQFVGGSYTGGGTYTMTTPAGSFLPGEPVEVVLTSSLTSLAGLHAAPVVTNYRVASAPATAALAVRPDTFNDAFVSGLTGAVADFNEDGHLDVATASFGGTSGIWKGDGTGGFAMYGGTVIGSQILSMTSGDWNSDGHTDVAAVNYSNGTVSVALGDGNAGFVSPLPGEVAVGANQPQWITAGDLNGDDIPDLVTANGENLFSGTVSVLLGVGNGSFVLKGTTSVGGSGGILRVILGDVDGDDDLDIVESSVSGGVQILINDGAANFAVGAPLGLASDIKLADLNHDDDLDLVLAMYGRDSIKTLLGNGAGGFTPFDSTGTGNGPWELTLLDLDGDDNLDVITPNRLDNTIRVLRGDGTGRFTSYAGIPAGGNDPRQVLAADFDEDGHPDVIPLHSSGISFFEGDGQGGLHRPLAVGDDPRAVVLGDFDGDHILDLATANNGSNDVTVRLGVGNGSFRPSATSPVSVGEHPQSIAAADLDGDGDLDLVTGNSGDDNVTILLGNGHGTFTEQAGSPYAVGTGPAGVAIGDLTGDGIPDIAVSNGGSASVTILHGTGSGAFTNAGDQSVSPGPGAVVLADLRGDGILDIVTLHASDPRINVLAGNGAGGYSLVNAGTGGTPTGMAVGDINKDGLLDVALSSSSTNDVIVMYGLADGDFVSIGGIGGPFDVAGSPQSVSLVDMNGDGNLDAVTANGSNNTVSILTGNGSPSLGTAAGSPNVVGHGAWAHAVGDVNGDGKLDVVTVDRDNNMVAVMLNQ